jgi:hypothetical protein
LFSLLKSSDIFSLIQKAKEGAGEFRAFFFPPRVQKPR